MTVSVLSDPQFHDEGAAFTFVEARLWPQGPVCFHCKGTERVGALKGKTTRPGLYKCYVCRKPFTVRMGTVFEASHIEMHKWLQAMFLMCSSKKGISTNQLHRTLRISLKSAWFLSHRIREAMTSIGFDGQMGGEGGIVEIDETFIGRKEGFKVHRGFAHKNAVMSLVERRPEGAVVRSFHVGGTAQADLLPIIKVHVSPLTHIMTDEAGQYTHIAKHFIAHDFTTHSKGEYVRDSFIHSNTVEGYYSVFKRGMVGTYQHCAEHHLKRYVAEFDFRYNNRVRLGYSDTDRAGKLLQGVVGKRLTYRTTAGAGAA
jgi:transposase-like protein